MPISVTLAPELEEIVNEKIASGEYPSASDVLNAALSQFFFEEQEEPLTEEELRREIALGLEDSARGEYKMYTPAMLTEWRDEIKTRLTQRHAEREKAST